MSRGPAPRGAAAVRAPERFQRSMLGAEVFLVGVARATHARGSVSSSVSSRSQRSRFHCEVLGARSCDARASTNTSSITAPRLERGREASVDGDRAHHLDDFVRGCAVVERAVDVRAERAMLAADGRHHRDTSLELLRVRPDLAQGEIDDVVRELAVLRLHALVAHGGFVAPQRAQDIEPRCTAVRRCVGLPCAVSRRWPRSSGGAVAAARRLGSTPAHRVGVRAAPRIGFVLLVRQSRAPRGHDGSEATPPRRSSSSRAGVVRIGEVRRRGVDGKRRRPVRSRARA